MNELSLDGTYAKPLDLEKKQRNYTVDIFRLLGAFSVVVLHTVSYGDLPPSVIILVKNSTRWAVPFFFLVSGYYFEKRYRVDPEKAILKNLKNLIGVFISSNIVYFFFNLYKGAPLSSSFSLYALMTGNYFHLWFIGSMIVGYLTMWFVLEQKPHKVALISATGLFLLFALCTGSYAELLGLSGLGLEFARHLVSVPFLLTGYICAKYGVLDYFSWPIVVLFIMIGFGIQLTEAVVLFRLENLNQTGHDFLFGTFLHALGIFFLSMKFVSAKESLFSKFGKDYSLLIYLYHPIFMAIGYTNFYFLNGIFFLSWGKPVGVLGICLFCFLVLHKIFPGAYRFINGSLWR